jgi:hypothetical protein
MSLSTDGIVSLLISQLVSLLGSGSLLFSEVAGFDAKENRITAVAQGAYIGLVSDESTDISSRLVEKETYAVIVEGKKGATGTRKINNLCDTVRDTIHMKDWGNTDLMPFKYKGRKLLNWEGEYTVYELDFVTTRVLQPIVTTT